MGIKVKPILDMGIRRSILVQSTEHNAATDPLLLRRICT